MNAKLNIDDVDEHFAGVIQTWSNRKFREKLTTQREALDWLYSQILVLLDSSRLNIAYKLLRVEHSERSSFQMESSVKEALDALERKFSTTLIDRLDKDKLKLEPKAASMLWSLSGTDNTAFNSLADSFTRFEKWFDIEAHSPNSVTNSNLGRFEFHKVDSDRIIQWGGMQKLESYLIQIANREHQSSSQCALVNAYRSPGVGFDVVTGEKLATG